jgi:hypothetical protein
MRLLLALPALLARPTASLPPLPALGRLLQAGGAPRLAEGGIAEWLAAHLGVAREHDVAFAAMRRRAEGREPQELWWLAADPVTLVAGRDDVRIAGVVDTRQRGGHRPRRAPRPSFRRRRHPLRVHRGRPWLSLVDARLRDRDDGARARCRRVAARPPARPDAALWPAGVQEIEMLLHADPSMPPARQNSPANGLWFSGGGRLPPALRPVRAGCSSAAMPTAGSWRCTPAPRSP